jgi:hypothetical protein
MKRSEATPGILKALEEPGNIYTFEEDEEEMRIIFPFMRAQGWLVSGRELTDDDRKIIDKHLKKILDELHGEGEFKKRYGYEP